jgi:hypothetical protein
MLYSQEADGLLALGNSSSSAVNQLVSSGAIDDKFSLCFGGVEGDGALLLGDAPLPSGLQLQYTPLLEGTQHPQWYTVSLLGIAVGGEVLPVDEVSWPQASLHGPVTARGVYGWLVPECHCSDAGGPFGGTCAGHCTRAVPVAATVAFGRQRTMRWIVYHRRNPKQQLAGIVLPSLQPLCIAPAYCLTLSAWPEPRISHSCPVFAFHLPAGCICQGVRHDSGQRHNIDLPPFPCFQRIRSGG